MSDKTPNVEVMSQEVVADAMADFDKMTTFEKMVPTVGDVRGSNAFVIPEAATHFFELAPFSYLRLPQIPVGDTKFSYWSFDLNDQVRGRAREYVDGGELETVGITGTEHTSDIKLRGLQSAIGDLTRAENKTGVNLEMQRTRTILNHVSMTLESEWAGIFNGTGNFLDDVAIAADKKWGDDAGTPIDDVLDAAERLYDQGAFPGSLRLFVSRSSWAALRKSKQVRESIGIGQFVEAGGIPNRDRVSAVLDDIPIEVCPALSMKGSQLFGKHAVLMAVGEPTQDSRSCMGLFGLRKAQVAGPAGLVPMMVRIPHLHADYVQIIVGFRLLTLNSSLGIRLQDTN